METSSLNRKLLAVCISALVLLFLFGCHAKSSEENDPAAPEIIEMGNDEFIEGDLKTEFLPQDVLALKNVVVEMMVPHASGKNKEELGEILKYLSQVENKAPAYFEDPRNLIEFLKHKMRVTLIAANLFPDNFDLNRIVSSHYITISSMISDWAQTSEDRRLSDEYKKKGVQAAEDLVKKFPDNGLSYAQLAHCLYVTGGDKKRVADLYKRCLALDADSDYCRKGYDLLLEELAAPEN